MLRPACLPTCLPAYPPSPRCRPSHVQKHGSIEAILEQLDSAKFPLPEPFPYKESRAFFKAPEVGWRARVGGGWGEEVEARSGRGGRGRAAV